MECNWVAPACSQGTCTTRSWRGKSLIFSGVLNPGVGRYRAHDSPRLSHVLAREPLRRNGDMLLLTDIYCMYNRARGTDLVSPDDVLAACRQLERLRLGMKLRLFNTGVMVVQSDSHDPKAVVKRLLALLHKRGYVDAAYLASTWRVSVPVAEEHLLVRDCVAVRASLRVAFRTRALTYAYGCEYAPRLRNSAARCVATTACRAFDSTPTGSAACRIHLVAAADGVCIS